MVTKQLDQAKQGSPLSQTEHAKEGLSSEEIAIESTSRHEPHTIVLAP